MMKHITFNTYEFEVKNCILTAPEINILIVQDYNTHQRYIFNQIFQTIPYIDQFITEENIVSLSDYSREESGFFFSYEDALILGFKYYDGLALEYYIKQQHMTDKRLLEMLEQLVISAIALMQNSRHSTPLIFDPRNIVITASASVEINFGFYPELTKDSAHSLDMGYEALSIIIRSVSNLVDDTVKPDLDIIADKCHYQLYNTLGDLAYAIKELRTKEHHGFYYKMKGFLLALKGKLAPLLKVAFFLLVLYYSYNYIEGHFLMRSPSMTMIGNYAIAEDGSSILQTHTVPTDHLLIEKESHQLEIPEKKEVSKSIPTASSVEDYSIQAGDTLSKIALKHYGSSTYAMPLAQYNALGSPNLIYPGDILKLPNVEALEQLLQ